MLLVQANPTILLQCLSFLKPEIQEPADVAKGFEGLPEDQQVWNFLSSSFHHCLPAFILPSLQLAGGYLTTQSLETPAAAQSKGHAGSMFQTLNPSGFFLQVAKLTEHLKPLTMRRMQAEIVSRVPSKVEIQIPVAFTSDQAEFYKQILSKFYDVLVDPKHTD